MVTAAPETLPDAPTSLPTVLESTRPAAAPAEAMAPAEAIAPAEAATPSRRSSLRFVLVLGALTAIGPLTIDTYLPALPSISRDLAASESAVQATLTGILLGMGLGQLLVGPLSDAIGRRKPLIAGISLHIFASVLCAFAPSVELLTFGRVLQGLGNAAVAVVAMATVRDVFVGSAAATLLSRLMLVSGMAPILAPSLGGAILRLTSWRGVFAVLGVAGVVLVTLASTAMRETLPVERRRPAAPGEVLKTYRRLLRDRTFVGLVLIAGLGFATLFGYIGGSSFVLQNVYGLSAAQFALVFGANSLGLILMSQVNPVLVRRHGPRAVLRFAVLTAAVAALVLLASAWSGIGGLFGLLLPLWVILASCGLTFPNTPALALSRHGEAAGTASALLGAAQFAIGGLAAPVIGLLGSGSGVPMAAVMATTASLAAVVAARTLRVTMVTA